MRTVKEWERTDIVADEPHAAHTYAADTVDTVRERLRVLDVICEWCGAQSSPSASRSRSIPWRFSIPRGSPTGRRARFLHDTGCSLTCHAR